MVASCLRCGSQQPHVERPHHFLSDVSLHTKDFVQRLVVHLRPEMRGVRRRNQLWSDADAGRALR